MTLENQIRGLGGRVRGPTASRAHRRLHRQGSQSKRGDRRSLCRHAGTDCGADCGDDGGRRDRRRHKAHDKGLCSLPPADDDSRRRPTDRARLCRRNRRSLPHPPIARRRRLSGLGSQAVSVWRGRYFGGISKCGDRRLRTLLYEAANVMLTRYKGQLKLKDWAFAIAKRSTMRKARLLWLAASRSSCTRCCETGQSSHRHKPRKSTRQEANRAP